MKPREEQGAAALDRWCEALDWYATLRRADAADLTLAVGRNWQQWYGIAENRCVFDAVSRLMAASAHYRRRRRSVPDPRDGNSYDLSLSIAEWRRAQMERGQPRQRRFLRNWWRIPGGLGLGAIALVLFVWSRRFEAGHGTTPPVIYETGPGGIKDVDLSDGSRLVLGQRTRLRVQYSTRDRSVNLISGEAWFEVTHVPHWPFIVTAGDGTITDVGTAFSVTREPGRVLVQVMDGRVEVATRPRLWPSAQHDPGLLPRLAQPRVVVKGGEQLAIRDNGVLGHVTRADSAASPGCRCGPLIFDNKTLRQVAAVLRPYTSKSISVGPAAGNLRLSGIVFRDEVPQWMRTLQYSLPVKVEERGNQLRILMRSPGKGAGR